MCKPKTEGPRCAAHTRGPAEAALTVFHQQGDAMLTEEHVHALAEFASTRTGRKELMEMMQQAERQEDDELEQRLIDVVRQGDKMADADREYRAMSRELNSLPENVILNGETALSDEAREIMSDLDYFQQLDVVQTEYDMAVRAVKRGDILNPGKEGEKQAEIDRLTEMYPDMMAAALRGKKDPLTPISEKEWADMLDYESDKFNRRERDVDYVSTLQASKSDVPRNLAEAKALLGMQYRASGAVSRLSREFRQIGGLHGVDEAIVAQEFEAIRQNYLATPENERPSVPDVHQNAVENSYWGNNKHKRPPMDAASAYALYALTHESERLAPYSDGSREYVVFDTETTGVNHRDRVLEVSAIVYDADGNEKERYSTYVHPGTEDDGSIYLGSSGAQAVHGITEGHLTSAPDEVTVATRLSEIMQGRVIVGHNVEFDYMMVNSLMGRAGVPPLPQPPMIDTVRLARYVQPRPEGMKATEFGHKLQNCCDRAGIPFDSAQAHGAEYDTLRAADLFFSLKPKILNGLFTSAPVS